MTSENWESLITVAFLLLTIIVIAVVILSPAVIRARERAKAYELLKVIYERGESPPPEIIAALGAPGAPTADRDIRRGSLLMAIGTGLLPACLLLAIGGPLAGEDELLSIGLFLFSLALLPIIVGVTLKGLGRTRRREEGGE